MYIKSDGVSKNYIGGRLFDIVDAYGYYDESEESEEVHTLRAEEMDNYILDFADYYICTNPKHTFFNIWKTDYTFIKELWESLAVKEGVDLIAYPDHLEAIGYYGNSQDIICLYPISETQVKELSQIIDNSDFEETDVIENEIAQYTWDGASVEDVLRSWA